MAGLREGVQIWKGENNTNNSVAFVVIEKGGDGWEDPIPPDLINGLNIIRNTNRWITDQYDAVFRVVRLHFFFDSLTQFAIIFYLTWVGGHENGACGMTYMWRWEDNFMELVLLLQRKLGWLSRQPAVFVISHIFWKSFAYTYCLLS